mmetsp:Transcript_29778/g.28476  ORF Transcript_29778/g.28476 Transcript_29778/m.28476 type:complete len:289 (-) Transcript_29778:501-1367(-)
MTLRMIQVSFRILLSICIAYVSNSSTLTPTNSISKLSTSLRSRDIAQSIDIMKSLDIKEMGSEAFISQLCRSKVSLTSTISDTVDYTISIITIPKSFSMPLHTRPGKVLTKILHGTSTLRELEILQFELEEKELSEITSFQKHDLAFASGDEDCVCRGGTCPRRESCIFWVQKQMRESGSSLFVSEKGYKYISAGDLEIIPETDGPREMINIAENDDSENNSAIFLQVLIKDLDAADFIEETPSIQFYRADRLDNAGVVGNKLKVTATTEPLGLVPMHVPWRGTKIIE